MIISTFKESVLLEPLERGFDELCVVSGYVSAAMVRQHLTGGGLETKEPHFGPSQRLNVICGMYPSDGIRRSDHDQLISLSSQFSNLQAYYIKGPRPVHSKVYVWLERSTPMLAFIGSANYTISAKSGRTEEAMHVVDPQAAYSYYSELQSQSVNCVNVSSLLVSQKRTEPKWISLDEVVSREELVRFKHVRLPLTSRGKGIEVPTRSGLNWGQRPELKRNPNQAYLSVPRSVQEVGFFPERGQYFTAITDDGQTLVFSRAQDEGKGLHTPDNSELGLYFRKRLGVAPGALVTIEHLLHYGRLDVEFFDLGDDTYFMEFRPK